MLLFKIVKSMPSLACLLPKMLIFLTFFTKSREHVIQLYVDVDVESTLIFCVLSLYFISHV